MLKVKNLIIKILLVVCLILVGALIYSQSSMFKTSTSTKEDVVDKALTFISENFSNGEKANLVGDIEEEEGLYKFQVEVQGQKFFSYITKSGKLLFPQGIDLEEEVATSQNGEGESPKTCEDIPKKDKPVLEAFVVSYCPFGAQMERILSEIVKNIPELAENIRIEYMGQVQDGKVTSMHDEKEAEENLRQICLREEQKEKFYSYLSCFLKESKAEECLEETGIDKEKLSQCMDDSSKGIAYAKEDFKSQDAYKITGSPTLILNGEKVSEFDFGGRTAEAVKTLLCCGFEKEFEVCSEKLSEEQAAAGFSETYSTGNSDSGACE